MVDMYTNQRTEATAAAEVNICYGEWVGMGTIYFAVTLSNVLNLTAQNGLSLSLPW